MKWNNLKNGLCPKCDTELRDSGDFVRCKDVKGCGFMIGQKKLAAILKPKTKSTEFQSEEERLSELNNYGREKRSEDFSDSPHLNY